MHAGRAGPIKASLTEMLGGKPYVQQHRPPEFSKENDKLPGIQNRRQMSFGGDFEIAKTRTKIN